MTPMMPFLVAGLLAAAHAEDPATRLENSPRHHEWVKVEAGKRSVDCFLVFPEVANKAAAVVVIHENRGLTDWVRSVADQLAEAGYIAIAPDLLSGTGPNGGNTRSFASSDAAREGIYALPAEQVTSDLTAVADYVKQLPACDGQVAVCGFCWGGGQAFRFATAYPKLSAAFVFYGTGPTEAAEVANVACPVYGFYGGNDARVNATIEKSQAAMAAAKKRYEPQIYPGAGHGFLRAGEEANASEANRSAVTAAWTRWKKLLAGMTPPGQ